MVCFYDQIIGIFGIISICMGTQNTVMNQVDKTIKGKLVYCYTTEAQWIIIKLSKKVKITLQSGFCNSSLTFMLI